MSPSFSQEVVLFLTKLTFWPNLLVFADKENEDEEGEVIDKDNVMEARMSTDEKVRVKILERFGEPGDQVWPLTHFFSVSFL